MNVCKLNSTLIKMVWCGVRVVKCFIDLTMMVQRAKAEIYVYVMLSFNPFFLLHTKIYSKEYIECYDKRLKIVFFSLYIPYLLDRIVYAILYIVILNFLLIVMIIYTYNMHLWVEYYIKCNAIIQFNSFFLIWWLSW